MNKTATALFIVVGLCIFALGVGGGVFYYAQNYYAQKMSPIIAKGDIAMESLNAFRSKVMGSITAFGQVKSISGRIVTLNQGGEDLAIRVKDAAEVIFYGTAGSTAKNPVATRTPADFKDIKEGEILNIEISILPDNQLEGRAVIILTDLKR